MTTKFDAIIVLGGGRINEGDLTELSIQRLDTGIELYNNKTAKIIFALGGFYSTYSSNAIKFNISGANLRKKYMADRGIKPKNIVLVENGRDTIGEAFASREKAVELKFKNILVVTSDKHLPRAIFIFKRIFGDNFNIEGYPVSCGNLLNENEEKEYLELLKKFFAKFPKDIPAPKSWEDWYLSNKNLYDNYKQIHQKYVSGRVETNQAYMGVR